jgi:RNA polymerase sigma-70 factor (ECF subfamily)
MSDKPVQSADEILLIAAQAGNAQALDMLISRWQKHLWGYVFRLTADTEASWDITQETWMAAIRGIRKLHDPAAFPTWIYRILTNKTNDWLKKKYQHAHFTGDSQSAADHRNPSTPQRNLEVREILAALPAPKRDVLCLYYFADLSVTQIAQLLEIPPGTVKSRLYQARKEFKQYWQPQT